MKNILFTLFVVVVLGAAFIAGAYIHGNFIYKSRMENSIKVVGFASKNIEADTVKWTLTSARDVDTKNMKNGYGEIAKEVETIKGVLTSSGITLQEIEVEPINAYPVYDNEGSVKNYTVSQNIKVVSKNIDAIERTAINPATLLDKGIALRTSNLGYFVSNLTDIKRELVRIATEDAKKRAQEVAGSTGGKLGVITAARTGVIQITEPLSNEISDYGVYNLSSRKKEIKTTVNITYSIK